ncbi:MAG: hypothetical protein MMC33_005751 [Icmadophila ericetorum]|nr:hypothetical protein [Icmadophila ericetorum]
MALRYAAFHRVASPAGGGDDDDDDEEDTPGESQDPKDEKVHAQDSKSLFITNPHAEREEQGESITSFFVRRSLYFAFLGERLDTFEGRRLGVEEERERQAPVENGNDAQEEVDSFQATGKDQRRDTQLEIERIIADGLASIREDPDGQLYEAQAAGNLEELSDSYRDLIGTDSICPAGDRQPGEQDPDRRLQIMAPSPSQVRIEFKIYERDVWKTDHSLLVDPSEPSEVERVAKEYMRKGFRPFDISFSLLVPRTCFKAVTADGTNTVLLVPENDICVNNQLVVFKPAADAGPSTGRRLKRDRRQSLHR